MQRAAISDRRHETSDMREETLDKENLAKLEALGSEHVTGIIEEYAALCAPERIVVLTDSAEDKAYAKKRSLELGEEFPLAMQGHTVHFDGPADQGRDKAKTKVLVSGGVHMSAHVNVGERSECLEEVRELLRGSMNDREMLVAFYCLGPAHSPFSILAMQITDSPYVIHSANLLYRPGYEAFKSLGANGHFFHFIHSAGELDEGVSKHPDKKRIYIDIESNRVFAVNVQYAGNSMGLKKLALRLAIRKAVYEGWLCEHMFIMDARPEGKNRSTGKTSTAMVPGQKIVGDDIAYIRESEDGYAYAANSEQGIFGILEDVNPVDDALIWKTLTTPRQDLIFSNVLIAQDKPYWLGMGPEVKVPPEGKSWVGQWAQGMMDEEDKRVPFAHKNARYIISLSELENVDRALNDPRGVPVSGVIYGGRDADTSPPVVEALDWAHGVFMGCIIESETTAATIGAVGVKKHDPFANSDFLSVTLGSYIKNHFDFGSRLKHPPKVFTVNYFLKGEDGKFLNRKVDKKVWLAWMEGRVHGEFEAIETPVGFIPRYEDVRTLFKTVFGSDYAKEDYERQFSIRTAHFLARLDRMEETYKKEVGMPEEFGGELGKVRERLRTTYEKHGKEIISPFEL